jgi:hypothetical protein
MINRGYKKAIVHRRLLFRGDAPIAGGASRPTGLSGRQCIHISPVGGGLLAMAAVQSKSLCLTHSYRQQAGSYKFGMCANKASGKGYLQQKTG